MSTSIEIVVNFLTMLFEKGLSYSSLNTARSSLSSFIFIDKKPVGEHFLIIRLLKGFFNLRPALPKTSCVWNPDSVLEALAKIAPAKFLDLSQLSRKLVCLLALVTGHRVHTLHMLDINHMTVTLQYVQFVIPNITKTTRPGFHPEPIFLEKFDQDKRLCVVFYIREYLERTREIRGDVSQLFITYQKPFKAATKGTIARWIKSQLSKCGVDMKHFTPHSTRSAATSRACQLVPLTTVLKNAAWTNQSTFAKHYHKPIMGEQSFAKPILENVVKKRRGGEVTLM